MANESTLQPPFSLIRRIPGIEARIRRFDKRVHHFGLSEAIRRTIERMRGEVEVSWQDEATKEVLEKRGALVIANHDYQMEPLALLAALPPREKDDVYVVATLSIEALVGPETAKHIIPIFGVPFQPTRDLLVKILRKVFPPKITKQEAMEKNKLSIAEIVHKIQQESLVIFFPQGSRGIRSHWQGGVGYILQKLGLTGDQIYYVKAYVEGTSKYDPLLLLLGGKELHPPRWSVTISSAQPVKNLLEGSNSQKPKMITQYLESEFHMWTASIHQE